MRGSCWCRTAGGQQAARRHPPGHGKGAQPIRTGPAEPLVRLEAFTCGGVPGLLQERSHERSRQLDPQLEPRCAARHSSGRLPRPQEARSACASILYSLAILSAI